MTQPDEKTGQAQKATTRRPPRRNAPKMRVLAVDDEPSILELLQTALNALGDFDVSIATSGEEALKQIDRAEPAFDCLLLDILMPHMNGITLCSEVRRRRAYLKTPIIMLTAMSERKYIDESFIAGATDYVTKPFDFFELRSRLSAAQRLIREQARANDSIEVARKLKEELDANLQFKFEDPVGIFGVERVLGHTEFENYVTQLSKTKLFNSYVTAIKIIDARAHYDKLSATAFREGLHDVAKALVKATRKIGNIMSYNGAGIFLVIGHGRNAAPDPAMATQLNQLIATVQASRQSDTRFQVILGDRVPMRSLSKSGALFSLTRAVESVEERDLSAKEIVKVKGGRGRGGGSGGEKSADDRRAYETILKDLLKEEPLLNSY